MHVQETKTKFTVSSNTYNTGCIIRLLHLIITTYKSYHEIRTAYLISENY